MEGGCAPDRISTGPFGQTVLSYGADEGLVADDFLLEHYCNQAYVKAVESAIRQYEPQVLLFGATAMGTDLAPRLAARLRTGLSADCIDLILDRTVNSCPWSQAGVET